MILPRYATAVAHLDRDRALSRLVRRALRLHRSRPMLYALRARGLGQADLVLALLHLETAGARLAIERILRCPVRVCPSVFLAWSSSGPLRLASSPKIVSVGACPARPGSDRARRFSYCFRPGLTVEQARARGATRRDVRRALRGGYLVVGEGRT